MASLKRKQKRLTINESCSCSYSALLGGYISTQLYGLMENHRTTALPWLIIFHISARFGNHKQISKLKRGSFQFILSYGGDFLLNNFFGEKSLIRLIKADPFETIILKAYLLNFPVPVAFNSRKTYVGTLLKMPPLEHGKMEYLQTKENAAPSEAAAE